MDEKEIIQQSWNERRRKHMLDRWRKLYIENGLERPEKDRKHEVWLLLIPIGIIIALLLILG